MKEPLRERERESTSVADLQKCLRRGSALGEAAPGQWKGSTCPAPSQGTKSLGGKVPLDPVNARLQRKLQIGKFKW